MLLSINATGKMDQGIGPNPDVRQPQIAESAVKLARYITACSPNTVPHKNTKAHQDFKFYSGIKNKLRHTIICMPQE